MRAAVIEGGKVANIILVDLLSEGMVDGQAARIGDEYDPQTGAFTSPIAPVNLSALKADAIAKTYVDVDMVYDLAIGRRATEYQKAEAAARAYVAAGYTGPVSPYISGHAKSNPTGLLQTNEWAADEIIARADAFAGAEIALRNTRFDRQADMRAATTPAQLTAAVAAWEGFIAALRSALGL